MAEIPLSAIEALVAALPKCACGNPAMRAWNPMGKPYCDDCARKPRVLASRWQKEVPEYPWAAALRDLLVIVERSRVSPTMPILPLEDPMVCPCCCGERTLIGRPVGCTLCKGDPIFEMGEYSDVITCQRVKPRLPEEDHDD